MAELHLKKKLRREQEKAGKIGSLAQNVACAKLTTKMSKWPKNLN